DETAEKRHAEMLREAERAASATASLESATWWMNRGTWALAVFAAIAALISWLTFRKTQKQSRDELRAYVHVKVEEVIGLNELNAWMDGRMSENSNSSMITGDEGPFWAHNPPRVKFVVSISNYGKTPAKQVTAN